MEKILNEILSEVKTIKTDINGLKDEAKTIKTDINGVKDEVKTIKTDINGLKDEVKTIKTDIKTMKVDISSLKEGQIRVETQVLENTQILTALEHAAHTNKAEHDNIINEISEIKGEIKNMRNNINTVELVTSQNWTEIARLKSIK